MHPVVFIGHVLVGAAELRNPVFLERRFETHELLFLSTVIQNTDGGGVDIFDDAIALCHDHGARVLAHLTLETGSHDR